MQTEIEAKFINVDHDKIRELLEQAGAVLEQPMRLMRRVVFHPPDDSDSYVRVRDEGHRVTMTYKRFHDNSSIHGVSEIETMVGDFDNAIAILEQTGLLKETYQETQRETWKLGDVEVVLDEWPWVEPFIEIEGPSEQAVRDAADQLGFDWKDAVFGGVASVYMRKYTNMGDAKQAAEIINRKTPVIRFEDPVPVLFR